MREIADILAARGRAEIRTLIVEPVVVLVIDLGWLVQDHAMQANVLPALVAGHIDQSVTLARVTVRFFE